MIVGLISCIEPIYFDVPAAEEQLVVEGMIHDGPGPYIVKVSTAAKLDGDTLKFLPVSNINITLLDHSGNSEILTESKPGIYLTGGEIQGKIGSKYHIRIKTPDGEIFESEPEQIYPVGEIHEIRYEYENKTIEEYYGTRNIPYFKLFVDSDAGESPYVRWRMTGVYKFITEPKFRLTYNPPYRPYKNPPLCSGYIVDEGIPGGILVEVGECTCCTCWGYQFEEKPQVAKNELIINNHFKNIKVGEVSINNVNFYEKYMVQVEQMSLTSNAYEFFKMVRAQKDASSNIFQPTAGTITGNIRPINSKTVVHGIFWATSIQKKSIFIKRDDLPVGLTPMTIYAESCLDLYPNTVNEQPEGWE